MLIIFKKISQQHFWIELSNLQTWPKMFLFPMLFGSKYDSLFCAQLVIYLSGCLNVTYLDFSQSSRGVNRIVPRWQFRRFVSGTFTITISGGATRSGSGYAVRIFIWDGNARSVANINGGSRVFDCKEKRMIKIILLDV